MGKVKNKTHNKDRRVFRFPDYEVQSVKHGDSETPIHPRVTFKSYEWSCATPKLANTMLIEQGSSFTSATTLYVPANFATPYGADWQTEEMVTGFIDKSLSGFGSSLAEATNSALNASFSGIANTAKYNYGVTSFPGQFLSFKQGKPINLSFTFDLLPESKSEADTIVELVDNFKRRMTPLYGDGKKDTIQFYLRFPEVWSISFTGLNGVGFPDTPNEYNNMALVDCTPSYSGSSQTALTFHDGNPSMVQLRLTFQSIKHPYIGGN